MSIEVKADCRLVTFHIPRIEYGALKRYTDQERLDSVDFAIIWALHKATKRIGLSSQDYEQISEEMRHATRK